MKNDPESIKLREDHQEWIKTSAAARESLEQAEIVYGSNSSWCARMLLRAHQWIARKVLGHEENARLAARQTYER